MFGALEAEDEFTLRQLLHRLEQFVADNKGAEAFANAINYFEKAVSTPDQFLNLVVSGVLSAVEGAAQLLIQAAQTVIDIVFDIVEALARLTRKALNAAWSIPFVSDLYKRVTGGELTAVDLVAMIVAIPGTIFYKLAAGAAPFPTESGCRSLQGTVHRSGASVRDGPDAFGCGRPRGRSIPPAAPIADHERAERSKPFCLFQHDGV